MSIYTSFVQYFFMLNDNNGELKVYFNPANLVLFAKLFYRKILKWQIIPNDSFLQYHMVIFQYKRMNIFRFMLEELLN